MVKAILSLSAAAALTVAVSAAQALPLPNLDGASSPHVKRVYGGCGVYGHRGPYGGCRPGGQASGGWHDGYWRGGSTGAARIMPLMLVLWATVSAPMGAFAGRISNPPSLENQRGRLSWRPRCLCRSARAYDCWA